MPSIYQWTFGVVVMTLTYESKGPGFKSQWGHNFFSFFFRWRFIFYVSDDIWFDYNNMIRKNMVLVMILLWMRFRWMIKRKKFHSRPGFEPGTVRSLSQRVNHYTKSACLKKLLKSWVFIRKDFQYLSWTPLKIKTENTGWMLMKNPI